MSKKKPSSVLVIWLITITYLYTMKNIKQEKISLIRTFFSVITYKCISCESKCKSGLTGDPSSTVKSPYSNATIADSTTTWNKEKKQM